MPVEHWFKVQDAISDRKHMEQVAVLKGEARGVRVLPDGVLA
ncbi:hypothetical protein [Pseudoxanthomonas sp. SE1]|nr:hypothetical protein [Pseudoxanthomonas sp. SE1]WFC41719.1 hypothetical protein OY559_18425 [Pseudoxanthomonas sp. SE1]